MDREAYDFSNRNALTYNSYVPISCGDIHRLDSARAILKRNNQPFDEQATASCASWFFGNHPILWVQVVGKVVDVFYNTRHEPGECQFYLDDGLGGSPLRCHLLRPAAHPEIKLGDTVLVFAKIQGISRANVIRLEVVDDVLRYYMLREENVAVRKYVLEKDATRFSGLVKPLKSIEKPRVRVPEVIHVELYRMHRHLREREKLWMR